MSSGVLRKTIHITSIAIYFQIVLFDLLLLISYRVPNLYMKPLHSSVIQEKGQLIRSLVLVIVSAIYTESCNTPTQDEG